MSEIEIFAEDTLKDLEEGTFDGDLTASEKKMLEFILFDWLEPRREVD